MNYVTKKRQHKLSPQLIDAITREPSHQSMHMWRLCRQRNLIHSDCSGTVPARHRGRRLARRVAQPPKGSALWTLLSEQSHPFQTQTPLDRAMYEMDARVERDCRVLGLLSPCIVEWRQVRLQWWTAGHAAYKINWCDGGVMYVDNGFIGGDDHIGWAPNDIPFGTIWIE